MDFGAWTNRLKVPVVVNLSSDLVRSSERVRLNQLHRKYSDDGLPDDDNDGCYAVAFVAFV